jgi:putative restriction endonuclease
MQLDKGYCHTKQTAMISREQWFHRLAHLHVYNAKHGTAPHKPLLLLVLLDLADEHALPELLPLSPELAFRFAAYWSVVAHRRTQRPDVRFPFHHLQSDGFWVSLDASGQPSANRKLTTTGRLNPDFLQFLAVAENRVRAMQILVETYFPADERLGLYALMGCEPPTDSDRQSAMDEIQRGEWQGRGRDARFRLSVVAAYDYSCALTGLSIMTVEAASIVDAAHIHAFSDSRNDDPTNGLALCKNAHWLFDQGIWTVADDYTARVAIGCFKEICPDQKALASYHGQPLRLPRDERRWPNREHLAWHRQRRFLGRGG